MTTKYPEGTRWAVRVGPTKFENTWARNTLPGRAGADRKDRWSTGSREKALSVMYEWRSACCPTAVLVRIPPPRPKRSVEERNAEAVLGPRSDRVDPAKAAEIRERLLTYAKLPIELNTAKAEIAALTAQVATLEARAETAERERDAFVAKVHEVIAHVMGAKNEGKGG